MPNAEKRCEFCGDNVSQNNYRRHLRRWHPEADGVFQLRTPSCDSTPSSETRHLIFETTFRSLSADYIRDATLCMLRRQEGNNVPAMSQYLSHYFPDIPEQYHMPLIVATFSAAQKVAATHGDTLLPGDDERICWARRSLARWTYGLSGVEKRCSSSSSGNEFLDRVSGRSTPTTLSAPIKNLEAPSNVHNVVLLSATPSRATSQSDEGDGIRSFRRARCQADSSAVQIRWRRQLLRRTRNRLDQCQAVSSALQIRWRRQSLRQIQCSLDRRQADSSAVQIRYRRRSL